MHTKDLEVLSEILLIGTPSYSVLVQIELHESFQHNFEKL